MKKSSRFILTAISMVFALFAFAPLVYAQNNTTTTDDGDTPVTVPKKYVSPEGLNHQVEAKTSEWVGIGREIGDATKQGLDAVVEDAEKFGSTKVGTFVLVMIAWKIMAHDVLGVVLGIPILIAGAIFWWQVMKRLFFGYQVLDKKEGRVKTYKRQEPYDFSSGEARATIGVITWLTLVGFAITMFTVIF